MMVHNKRFCWDKSPFELDFHDCLETCRTKPATAAIAKRPAVRDAMVIVRRDVDVGLEMFHLSQPFLQR